MRYFGYFLTTASGCRSVSACRPATGELVCVKPVPQGAETTGEAETVEVRVTGVGVSVVVKERVAEEEGNTEGAVKVAVTTDGDSITDTPDDSGRKCEQLD